MRNFLIFCGFILFAWHHANAYIHLLESDQDNQYYIEYEMGRSWNLARMICKDRNMKLVTIDSKEKHKEISEMLMVYFSDESLSNLHLWIGATNENDGTFAWIADNKQFKYTNWSSDANLKDINSESNLCIELQGKDLRWNAVRCSSEMSVLCEGTYEGIFGSNELAELKKSHVQALNVAWDRRKKYVLNYKKYYDEQKAAKLLEYEELQLKYNEEMKKLDELCDNKILVRLDNELKMSKIQRHENSEKLTNLFKSQQSIKQAAANELKSSDKECIYQRLAELAGVYSNLEGDEQIQQREKNCVESKLVQ